MHSVTAYQVKIGVSVNLHNKFTGTFLHRPSLVELKACLNNIIELKQSKIGHSDADDQIDELFANMLGQDIVKLRVLLEVLNHMHEFGTVNNHEAVVAGTRIGTVQIEEVVVFVNARDPELLKDTISANYEKLYT